jgi:DNA-directed RNA polymerase subunit RPC12/RpoP
MMIKHCDKCGLPPDLCMCVKHNGVMVTREEHRRIHGLEVVAPHRSYHCTKCGGQFLQESQIAHSICPCCQRPLMKHKGCGGTVVQDSDWLPRLY